METFYPHQLVIQEYNLSDKTLGAENDDRIERINAIIENEDSTSDELELALKESKLIAAALINRFAKIDKSDVQNFYKEQKKKEEVSDAAKEAAKEIKQQIEDLKQKEEEEEEEIHEPEVEEIHEPEVEEVDAPDGKNSKIQAIVDFFETNSEATETDLVGLGLKNIQGVNEIILIPEKFKIVKKGDKYILKKKSDGILGWVLFGIGALVAGFFGYNYYKNNK